MKLRLPAPNNATHLVEVVEVHSSAPHAGCDVTVINPATGRNKRIKAWTADLVVDGA